MNCCGISDATSLYPSAMWDENSIFPRIETGYAFTKEKNNKVVRNSIVVNLIKEVLS